MRTKPSPAVVCVEGITALVPVWGQPDPAQLAWLSWPWLHLRAVMLLCTSPRGAPSAVRLARLGRSGEGHTGPRAPRALDQAPGATFSIPRQALT